MFKTEPPNADSPGIWMLQLFLALLFPLIYAVLTQRLLDWLTLPPLFERTVGNPGQGERDSGRCSGMIPKGFRDEVEQFQADPGNVFGFPE